MRFQYSFSRIETYLWCPLLFKFRYVDKRPEPKNKAMILGSIVHEAIAELTKHLINNGQEHSLGFIPAILKKYEAEAPLDVVNEARNILDSYLPTIFVKDFQKHVEVEQRLAFDENWRPVDFFDRDVFFRAVVDRFQIEGDLGVIIDYKTNRVVPPKSEIENNLQLEVYAWVESVMHPQLDEFLIRLEFVRYNAVRQRTIYRSEVERVPEQIMNYVERIEADTTFEPRLNEHCGTCAFQDICPLFQDVAKHEALPGIHTEADAIEAANQLRMMKDRIRQLDGMLREWVELNGPVQLDDQVLDFVDTERVVITDVPGLVAALLEMGFKKEAVWGILSTNKTNLKKLLKAGGMQDMLDELLEKFAEVDFRTEFKFLKAPQQSEI